MTHLQDPLNAFQAKSAAQELAFAPIVFQTALAMRDLNILSAIDSEKAGVTATKIATITQVSPYGVQVLLDMAMSAKIILFNETNKTYKLSNLGFYLLHDEMTITNMNFTAHVCYKAMSHLTQAIATGKPCGLTELGDWDSIYEGLSKLTEPAKTSWFEFDHFYSDRSFPILLETIFKNNKNPHIVDIGGNTGKWALQCCNYSKDAKVTIVDLPQQIAVATENITNAGFQDRVDFHSANMLSIDLDLPKSGNIWWMSQFLDCFSPVEILHILKGVYKNLPSGASVYILELFWDAQKYSAAQYSLNATSLYFTCLANGNSRFYKSCDFINIIKEAGFKITSREDNIGLGHTLLKLDK